MKSILEWRRGEPFSVNVLTDHILFCPRCHIEARIMAKSCIYIQSLINDMSKRQIKDIDEIFNPDTANKIKQIVEASKKVADGVYKMEVCEKKEERFSKFAIRKNLILPFRGG